ncbi:L-lactate dehydrogenase [Treponema sp.]|uniref:L-lactate dehydrogenase n=1 Tax=Treponema sp. TaxID=166 RepID=UPI0025E7D3C0|nr:L-lactate dehydrogenase [Treponema sp.]MCR5218080.1 L-lactate dehydrogenase [Treponema sp.]
MANKITIIGAGQVGSSIAYALSLKGTATEIVLIDIDTKRAMGEAMDIRQGTPYMNPVNIHEGTYEDARGSNIVVITSGVARKPGQTRLELAQTNVDIMKSIIPQVTKACPDAIFVIVANPVDVLTYQFAKTSGIPSDRIIGTGTLLDTARLRTRLADDCGVAQPNVHAYVFGEHGDSSFVPWSLANIASIPVEKFPVQVKKDDVETYVRKSGGIIIEAKRCTNYAIGVTTAELCEIIKHNRTCVTSVSSVLNGEYGLKDVALSILTKVGGNGIQGRLEAPLTDTELASLTHSADCLKDVIKQLTF